MKTFCYSTDIGGIYVGYGDTFAFVVPNGYGDGMFHGHIYDNYEEWQVVQDREEADGVPACNRWRFFTSFEAFDGGAWVANGGDLPAGRYGCYYKSGDVSIVKWD